MYPIEWIMLLCQNRSFEVENHSYRLIACFASWWRHQMETFSALLAFCAGNSPVPDEFPAQRPVTRSFDVFFDLRPNKRLSKQWWGWWSETPSSSLWRHRDVLFFLSLPLFYVMYSDKTYHFWCIHWIDQFSLLKLRPKWLNILLFPYED